MEETEFFELNNKPFPTRKKFQKKNKKPKLQPQQTQLIIKEIIPKTLNQEKTFDAYDKDKSLLLNGIAGCGKSFLSLYLSLDEILANSEKYKKLYIIRSVVSTRDMGFLPGNVQAKSAVYEAPYYGICSELFGRGDAYELLKRKDIVEFTTSSFLRGTTFRDSILFVDEFQNMTLHEFSSIITRIGENCKVIVCGDYTQSDHVKQQDKNEVKNIIKILDNMKSVEHITFTVDDIQRNKLVKEFIVTKQKLGLD